MMKACFMSLPVSDSNSFNLKTCLEMPVFCCITLTDIFT